MFIEFAFHSLEVVAEALSLLLGLTSSSRGATSSTAVVVSVETLATTSSRIEVLAIVLLIATRIKLVLGLTLRLVVVVLVYSILHRSASTHDRVLVSREGLIHIVAIHLLAEHSIGSGARVAVRSSSIFESGSA